MNELEALRWLGNVGIIAGLYFVGNRVRLGQLGLASGALAWCATGIATHDWALASLNAVTFSLSIRGWLKWAPSTPTMGEIWLQHQQEKQQQMQLAAVVNHGSPWTD